MKGLMVMSKSWGRFQRVGSGSLSRLSGGEGVLFDSMWVLLCLCVPLHVVFFFTWNFFSSLCCREMFLILWGLVPVVQGLWSFSCSPFLMLLAASSFLFPRILLLFYYSTETVFLLDSFLPFLFNHHLLGEMVCIWLTSGLPWLLLQVLWVSLGIRLSCWLPTSLFLHLYFE